MTVAGGLADRVLAPYQARNEYRAIVNDAETGFDGIADRNSSAETSQELVDKTTDRIVGEIGTIDD